MENKVVLKTMVYSHREKEDNWDIIDELEEKDFEGDWDKIRYLGSETEFEIEIHEDGTNKILKINDVDVSDKNISL